MPRRLFEGQAELNVFGRAEAQSAKKVQDYMLGARLTSNSSQPPRTSFPQEFCESTCSLTCVFCGGCL
jgi:hypothetical protein